MNEPLGFSVRIFVPSGDPEGPRVIEKSNWTGQGLIFPRSLFAKVRHMEELIRTGVYILWGPGRSEQLPYAYVGEGDVLLPRLNSHAKNKDFWTHGVAFTSKDQSLNKAHVQHLEARLVQLATEAKRCELDNANIPQMPSLSTADMADAELYLADMLLCLPVVGVSFFEKSRGLTEKNQDLFLNAKRIKARGFEEAGGFVVRAGSQAAKKEVASIPASTSDLRKALLNQGIFEDVGTAYRLVQDYIFSSPSAAADVLLGSSSNGRTEWKDAEGRSLKEIQGEEVELSEVKLSEVQQIFWKGFEEYVTQHGQQVKFTSILEERGARNYMTAGQVGLPKFSLVARANKSELRAEVAINHGELSERLANSLMSQKAEIEQQIGEKLRAKMMGNDGYMIYSRRDVDLYDPETRTEQYTWLLNQLEKFHLAFSPRVRKLESIIDEFSG